MSLQQETMAWLCEQAPEQSEYIQAVESVLDDIVPIVNANEQYKKHNVLQRLLVPDQVVNFKIEWEDDEQNCRVNQGWRVQHSNAIGPYKGGTRFVPSLTTSVLKFLAFEQSFKNALTGLSIGSAKGGCDFNPKHASEAEMRRFTNAYMEQLHHHIGAHIDVPAGDIGVSARELGWMFSKYLKLTKSYSGALSGKPIGTGGSELRIEATGFGLVYLLCDVLSAHKMHIDESSIAVSGAGNVALHVALKAIEMGACVKTLSNSRGTYVDESGIAAQDIQILLKHGSEFDNALEALAEDTNGSFKSDLMPWEVPCDIAIPCATQNEVDESCAKQILDNKTKVLIEGANMPLQSEAEKLLKDNDIIFVPGKAANAGGVILSTFEMQQNANFRYRDEQTLNSQLQVAMQNIHKRCEAESIGNKESSINYSRSATVASFRTLADATVAGTY